MAQVEKKTLQKAEKIRNHVDAMIMEITNWKGKRPDVVRVRASDYLVLAEVGWLERWPGITVKVAP